MRRLLFACFVFTTVFLISGKVHAQQQRLGYFDEQRTLKLFSELSTLDSVMDVYRADSVGGEYERRSAQIYLLDSLYKKNCGTASATSKSCEVAKQELEDKRDTITNWLNYARALIAGKNARLLYPYRVKIANALQEIVAEKKYTHVIQISAMSIYFTPPIGDNLCIRVGMKLGLPFSKRIIDQMNAFDAKYEAKPVTKPAATPPAKKK